MPFLNGQNEEAFQLNKTRSVAVYCCACGLCCGACAKSCGVACCGFDNEYSNLTVNKNGTSDYYIKQVPMANGHPYFTIENKKNGQNRFHSWVGQLLLQC